MKHLSKTEFLIFAGLSGVFAVGILLTFAGAANKGFGFLASLFWAMLSNLMASAHIWVVGHPFMAASIMPATVFAIFVWQARKARRYF